MAKAKALKPKQSREVTASPVDFTEHEARSRFERAIDFAVASKPLHKPTKQVKQRRR
jgi:hypothetical protein